MKTPLEILRRYPTHDGTLWGAFQSRAQGDARRPFMLSGDRTWTWGGFGEAVEATARLLIARGIRSGDRVGVMGANSDGHVLMLFALVRIGGIMVPVNPEFGVQEAR